MCLSSLGVELYMVLMFVTLLLTKNNVHVLSHQLSLALNDIGNKYLEHKNKYSDYTMIYIELHNCHSKYYKVTSICFLSVCLTNNIPLVRMVVPYRFTVKYICWYISVLTSYEGLTSSFCSSYINILCYLSIQRFSVSTSQCY